MIALRVLPTLYGAITLALKVLQDLCRSLQDTHTLSDPPSAFRNITPDARIVLNKGINSQREQSGSVAIDGPGATCKRLRAVTGRTSTPGRFLKALATPFSSPYTTNGPLRPTYLLFLILPLPRRMFRLSLAFLASSSAPICRQGCAQTAVSCRR